MISWTWTVLYNSTVIIYDYATALGCDCEACGVVKHGPEKSYDSALLTHYYSYPTSLGATKCSLNGLLARLQGLRTLRWCCCRAAGGSAEGRLRSYLT